MSEEILNDDTNVEDVAKPEEAVTEATPEEKKAEIAKLDAILERKGKKVAALNDALKDDKPEEEQKPITTTSDERLERAELRIDGYSPEIVEKIMAAGGKAALANELLKTAADGLQAQHNAALAADITSGPKSAIEKKYSEADLAKMSISELEAVLPHAE